MDKIHTQSTASKKAEGGATDLLRALNDIRGAGGVIATQVGGNGLCHQAIVQLGMTKL